MRKPGIAVVNGFAMGGGFEIALACHLVVADSAAVFGLPEVKVGLIAGAGGIVRLPRALPRTLATEMILTGRRMTAAEALSFGLVNRVTEPGEALGAARALAAGILEGSPTSVRASLQLMTETDGIADTVAAVTHPSSVLDDVLLSEDMVEGVTAFASKRKPVRGSHLREVAAPGS
jgi:acetyl-CoA C-acetyltransferase